MSQAGIINTSSGPSPPNVPTSFVTDVNSPAVPIANVLNILAGYTSANDIDGLRTDGSSGSNTVTIQITNRYQTTQSFSDAASHTIYTQALGVTPAAYLFEFSVVAFNVTSNLMSAYAIKNPIRTTGAAAIGITPADIYQPEEGVMSGVTITSGVSANNFIIEVQGYNTDTISYNLTGTYTVVT